MFFLLINITISALYRSEKVSALVFALFYGSAYQIGQFDWYSYETLYQTIQKTDTITALLVNSIGHYEPIFSIVLVFASRIIEEYWIVKTILYFISFHIFIKSVNRSKIRNRGLFCFAFLSLTGFPILYTTDRQAIALLIGLAFFINDKKSLWTLGFHYSAALLYLLRLSKKTVVTLSPAIILVAFLISQKYLYLISVKPPANSSFMLVFLLTVLLLVTRKTSVKNIFLILLLLTSLLMFSPALMYRAKIYIYVIVLVMLFRDLRVKMPKNIFFVAALSVSVALNIFYVNSDELAFGKYQTHLLKNTINYQDKTRLWAKRFKESET